MYSDSNSRSTELSYQASRGVSPRVIWCSFIAKASDVRHVGRDDAAVLKEHGQKFAVNREGEKTKEYSCKSGVRLCVVWYKVTGILLLS